MSLKRMALKDLIGSKAKLEMHLDQTVQNFGKGVALQFETSRNRNFGTNRLSGLEMAERAPNTLHKTRMNSGLTWELEKKASLQRNLNSDLSGAVKSKAALGEVMRMNEQA